MPNRTLTNPLPPRTINLLVGLVRSYMELKPEQVVVYNQKWRIPKDERIYISIAYLAVKVFGVSDPVYETFGIDAAHPGGLGLKEVISVNEQETFTIKAFSRGEEAILRKDEIPMALASTLAQQLCEQNSIKIGQVPVGMAAIPTIDGTAEMNQFVTTINVLACRSKERVVEYFDKFEAPGLVINP